MKSLHLFAGAGGGMLADRILGHEPVCAVEIDAGCRAVLAKRFPGATPHDDIRTFDGLKWRGKVDIVCGGWPCQDLSVAGTERGMAHGSGTRSALFWELLRVLIEVDAPMLFAENVDNLVRGAHRENALKPALAALSEAGYGGAWCIMPASHVGAPHLRRRFWLLAKKGRAGFSEIKADGFDPSMGLWPTPRVGGRGTFHFVRRDGKVRDDLETTCFIEKVLWNEGRHWPTPTVDMQSSRTGRYKQGGMPLTAAVAIEESRGKLWPTPTVQDGENCDGPAQFSRNTLPLNAEVFREMVAGVPVERIKEVIGDLRLNPDWVENLMGWPEGWTNTEVAKPRIHRHSDHSFKFPALRGLAQAPHEPPRLSPVATRSKDSKARNARLKMLGNGQVPQCAAQAFRAIREHLAQKGWIS